MITQAITDTLNGNVTDTATVAGLMFAVVLVIYFYVKIKPGLDTKIRINRQVQRRIERDRVNVQYQKAMIKQQLGKNAKTSDIERVFLQRQQEKNQKKPYRKNNSYYKKDKGYQAYLKHNAIKTTGKQIKKHNSFKTASGLNKDRSTIKLAPDQSFNKKADSFVPFSKLSKRDQASYIARVRKANGL